MNFCGGTIESQVRESPVVSLGQHHSGADGTQYHHHVDLPVHPTCMVKTSQPQNSNSSTPNKTSVLKITKKKLQQPQQTPPSSSHNNNSNNNKSAKTPPRSRSRSGSRSRRTTLSIEEGISGMQIVTPARQTATNLSARSSPSPRMLNPLSPQRIAEQTPGLIGLPSFSNMKTLDTLLKRLENGFRVTIHNGSDPDGKRVFLTLLQNRTNLMIRPVSGDEGSMPSVKFPVRTILRLEIGKTKSSVLGRSIYEHVHPMTCFSIVVKLWTDAETYFDFEASSVIEREALISTLMVVLDQTHNNVTTPTHTMSLTLPGMGPAAWINPRKASPKENTTSTPSSHGSPAELKKHVAEVVCLSPGRRTKIYSSTYFADYEDDQQGTEISLVYPPGGTHQHHRLHEDTSPAKKKTSRSSSSSGQTKPLRQRQLQPAVESPDDAYLPSPPRTTRFRQSPRDFMTGVASKPHSSKSTSPAETPRKHTAPMEVVVVEADRDDTDEHHDGSDSEGGFIIMPHNHPNQPESDIEIGLGGSPDHVELSFDIASQGLPVSKIQFSPTRDNFDPQSGCCSIAPPNLDHANPNVAWCSDDICTLALKDIAETCTGIFDQKGDNANLDMGEANTPGRKAAERVFVEEYIAGVLGGPRSALGAFFPEGDVWNVDSSKRPGRKVNRIRNRASLLNAQAIRLRTLRNEMTFAAALKRSKEKMQYVQTTKSFDDADSEHLRQAQERSVNRLHSSALMQRVMGTMVLSKPEVEEDDDAVYYDSDPEDVRPRTKGVRRALADRCNLVGDDEAELHQTRPVLSGVGFERIAVGKKLRKLDEGLIIQIVQAMRNETLTLMWHPTQSDACPNRSPICVNLWIESGVYLVDGSFLLPRLSWSVAYEDNLDAKKLNVSKAEPDQIDLLDVCRIRVTDKIDRKLHPFPDPRKSFVIETQDETYLFEAQTADERNRIVYGYKLVIARLASLLMLRDSRAVEEFFGSASAMVPGGFSVGK